MTIVRTILFTAATAIVSFAFVMNGMSRVLAWRYTSQQHEDKSYQPARQLLDQSIMEGWAELRQNAESLEERIDRPVKLRGKHVKLVTGKSVTRDEIDKLVKDCDKFTGKVRDAIRNEHKKFKKHPHDYQHMFSDEQHDAWHEIDDNVRMIKLNFVELRLTGW